jgi:hypothetical protein
MRFTKIRKAVSILAAMAFRGLRGGNHDLLVLKGRKNRPDLRERDG